MSHMSLFLLVVIGTVAALQATPKLREFGAPIPMMTL
jgi:hypothetical protein